MTLPEDLRQAERRAFRAAFDDGLWDVLIAAFVAMFAIAPLLSESLGDFWSSAVFVPVLLAAYLVIRLVRSRLVIPRVGMVRVGEFRQRRLLWLTSILLAINVIAFVGGLVASAPGPSSGWAAPIAFWLIVLSLCSVAAYFLDTPRLYGYGLMLAAAVPIGEWLFREGYATHHGYPAMFGLAATVIAAVGLIRFVRLLARTHRAAPMTGDVPDEG